MCHRLCASFMARWYVLKSVDHGLRDIVRVFLVGCGAHMTNVPFKVLKLCQHRRCIRRLRACVHTLCQSTLKVFRFLLEAKEPRKQ